MQIMPIFKTPIYSKITNNGQVESSYLFGVIFEANEERISFVATDESSISLESLNKCILENIQWWNAFIGNFLQMSSKLFSKPYTVDHINKIVKHSLNKTPTSFPINVLLTPDSIQIKGGTFIIHWGYTCESLVINIPDFEDESDTDSPNTLNKINSEFEELDVDDVPMDKNTTEETLELENSAMLYDKQKVKESQLKAKIAMYKAQHQLERFYEKYGTDITDSESESED